MFMWRVAFAALVVVAAAKSPVHEYTVDDANGLKVGNHSFSSDTGLIFTVTVGANDVGLFVSHEDKAHLEPFTVAFADGNAKTIGKPMDSPLKVPVDATTAGIGAALPRSALPKTLNIRVEFHPRLTFTYTFELQNVKDIAPGTYDMKPGNASLGVYFVLRVGNNSLSWYLRRKPPIPNFLFHIHDRFGKVAASRFVTDVPADGMGFTDIVDMKDVREEHETLRFTVKFFEEYRSRHGSVVIDDVNAFGRKLSGSTDEDEEEESEESKSLQAAEGGNAFEILKTSESRANAVQLKVERFKETGVLSVMLLQPHPIHDVILSATDLDSGRRLFLEGERQVAYVAKDSDATQFGWYHVIPFNSSETTATRVKIDVWYNDRIDHADESRGQVAAKMLLDWVKDFGGYVDGVRPVKRGEHTTLVATRRFNKGEVLAAVPFRLLLSSQITEAYEWGKKFKESSAWAELQQEESIPSDFTRVVTMVIFILFQPNSPFDGTNWRLYVDTLLPKQLHGIPMYWEPSLVDELLSFSYVANEVKQQQRIWRKEYQVLADVIPWLAEHISQQKYLNVRGHVSARVLNVTNLLVLPPVANLLAHDDAPNIVLHFNEESRYLQLVASVEIHESADLAFNYGSDVKSKQEFLVHYGSVPHGAADAVVVKNVMLTKDKRTRTALANAIKAEGTTATEKTTLEQLQRVLQAHLSSLPTTVTSEVADKRQTVFANRILDGERNTLRLHLQWLEEELEEIDL